MEGSSGIGINIKKLRMKRSLSQEELGRRVGLSKGSISKIESGSLDPSTVQLSSIAKALGCSPVDFFHEGPTMREDVIAFWDRVKSTCTTTGILQKELYEAAELDPKVALHWSNVCILPSIDAILKFAAYLGVDVYWLVYGNEIPNAQTMMKKLNARKTLTLDGALATIESLERRIAELEGRSKT